MIGGRPAASELLIITNNKLEVVDGIGNGSFMSTINIFLSSCFLLNWILAGVRYFNVRF